MGFLSDLELRIVENLSNLVGGSHFAVVLIILSFILLFSALRLPVEVAVVLSVPLVALLVPSEFAGGFGLDYWLWAAVLLTAGLFVYLGLRRAVGR